MQRVLLAILWIVLGTASAGADSSEDEAKAAYASGDYTRAAVLTRPFAEQGQVWAQKNLGWMYQNGKGVPKLVMEAVMWYRKAAEQGDAWAQNNLGSMYDTGRGVPLDKEEAVVWYRKSAEQGNAWAQYSLGRMYQNGTAVSQDAKEWVTWIRKAAEQGLADAQMYLGDIYYTGRGLLQDYSEAERWWQMAAAQGVEGARSNLGVMYEKTDRVRAYMWFSLLATLSSVNFSGPAQRSRNELMSQMTAEEFTKAQEMARRCQETKFKDCGYKVHH
jgi:TPR repeat protein